MTNIKGDKVTLRAVEPADVNSLYEWENDADLWAVSGTTSPFSHHTLALFIESQKQDIFASRQLRLMICSSEDGQSVGVLDLFEFDPLHHRVGCGIMIAPHHRNKGYGADALRAVESYASNFLGVHQIWCNVESDNLASLKLFESLGYTQVGVKKEWNARPDGYVDEVMMQKVMRNA